MLRAVTFAQGNVVLPDNLPMSMTGKSAGLHPNQSDSLADNEKKHNRKHLRENAGNICRTAKTLGISRSTLYYKLKKYISNFSGGNTVGIQDSLS
jgi:transcriptional regulator of acetoin/glycerol metabolism